MPLLKIIKYGHPLLREKAFEMKSLTSTHKELIEAMAETMYAARGIGLAATQVGVMERLFVADAEQERHEDGTVERGTLHVVINPEIVWESEEDESYNEGCLSIPEIEGEVFRPGQIKIVGRDQNFDPFELEPTGLLARVFQHETDHLNGVLFVDRLPLLKRSLLAGRLNKLKQETQNELPGLGSKYPVFL